MKTKFNPYNVSSTVWIYDSPNKKSLEFYVRGLYEVRTQSFRISVKKLARILRELTRERTK